MANMRELSTDMDIPFDVLTFITPNDRKILFKNLLENYKVFCPALKLRYAYLNFNSKLQCDYILVFSDKNRPGMMVWDYVYQYTTRTLPGYKYSLEQGKQAEFFKMLANRLYIAPVARFKKMLPLPPYNLSWDSNADNAWNKIENINSLNKLMVDISTVYIHK